METNPAYHSICYSRVFDSGLAPRISLISERLSTNLRFRAEVAPRVLRGMPSSTLLLSTDANKNKRPRNKGEIKRATSPSYNPTWQKRLIK